MEKIIKNFCSEETRFLSNFYPYKHQAEKYDCNLVVEYMGIEFDCVEKAYQAAKCQNRADMFLFRDMTAAESKKAHDTGQFAIREDWSEVKFRIMYELVWQKFHNCEELRRKLLDTGDAELIEGNTWGDIYWGICEGIGENNLGKILMRVRNAIK